MRKLAITYQELPNRYFDFIMNWLPNYSIRDEVLESDILSRYIDDEEVCEEDLEWLPESKEEAREQLGRVDLKLYNESVEAREKLLRMKWAIRKSCEDIKCSMAFDVRYRYPRGNCGKRTYDSFYTALDEICQNYDSEMLLLKIETEKGIVDILECLTPKK